MMARLILFTAAVANIGAAFGAAAHMYAADDITFAPTVLMLCCLAAAFLCGCAIEDIADPMQRVHGEQPDVPKVLTLFHD
jgi:hypothetical protein